MKKIIIAIVVIILLACGAGFVYFYNFTPEARAKNLASSYMSALLSNDTEKINTLYTPKFPIENVTQRNYRIKSIRSSDELYYLLYEFTNSTDPTMIRITVKSDSITDVTSGSSLGSTPSEDKQTTNEQTQQARCLDRSDLTYLEATSVYARNIRGATMVFLPESSDYSNLEQGGILLDRIAGFYEKAKEKDFVFELKAYRQNSGLTQDESELLDELFQRRATALQKELTMREVPLDRVQINNRYNYYIPGQSTVADNDLYVDINIVNRCIKE